MLNRVLMLAVTMVGAGVCGGMGLAEGSEPPSSREIFEDRIMAIFKSPKPSSCVQCHLSSVDLKDYILPSHEDTFVSLRDSGLIDLEEPRKSKILHLIKMGEDEADAGAAMIHREMRAAEYEAFAGWIEASCADPVLRDAPPLPKEDWAGPARADEVIRHNRMDRLLASFEDNVWSLRFRCAACHMRGGKSFQKHFKKHGEDVEWMKAGDPEGTMRYLMSDPLLVDVEFPEKSWLLLKPLDVEDHGGGVKMRLNDTDYMAYLNWIRDYAKVMEDGYEGVGDLPSGPRWVGTESWLRLKGVKESWVGRSWVATLHRWEGESGGADGFREAPSAVASSVVFSNPKLGLAMMNGILMVNGAEGRRLTGGRYEARLYLDEGDRATSDWEAAISRAELVGKQVLDSEWKGGFLHGDVFEFDIEGAAE